MAATRTSTNPNTDKQTLVDKQCAHANGQTPTERGMLVTPNKITPTCTHIHPHLHPHTPSPKHTHTPRHTYTYTYTFAYTYNHT